MDGLPPNSVKEVRDESPTRVEVQPPAPAVFSPDNLKAKTFFSYFDASLKFVGLAGGCAYQKSV
jgi:hypothetical protein